MKVIKLIEEDKYKIEQTFKVYTNSVYEIIVIKYYELISI